MLSGGAFHRFVSGAAGLRVAVVNDESATGLGFDMIVQSDVVALERGSERGELLYQAGADDGLNFLLDLVASGAFNRRHAGIFAGGDETAAGSGLNAINKSAKDAFEVHEEMSEFYSGVAVCVLANAILIQ